MKVVKLLEGIFLFFFITSCSSAQTQEFQNKIKPKNIGESIVIGEKIKIYSDVLGEEKEIYISLPPKYHERIHRYPVVFTVEAEFLFEATNTVTKYMAARSKMPQSIVVGIANGKYQKRNELSLPTQGGRVKDHLRFFKEELIPYIEKHYRVNSHRTIIGLSPSMGLPMEAFWSGDGLFKGYIVLSAHMEWQPEKDVRMVDKFIKTISDSKYPNSSIYLGRADSDLQESPHIKKAFSEAAEELKKIKKTNVTYKIDVLEGEEHYLMSIAGLRAGFELIYPNTKWRNPGWDKNVKDYTSYINDYYDGLSADYGFDILPVEDGHAYGYSLTGLIYLHFKWRSNKETIALLNLSIGYYPNSANLHMLLAQALKKDNKVDLALQSAEKAIKLAQQYCPDQLENFKSKMKQLDL